MNQREASTKNWDLFDNVSQKPIIEELNSGSLQRIADATEKMAASYDSMRNERDRYKTWYEDRGRSIDLLQRRMAALRGVITKLKKARALPLLTAFILALLASTTYGQRKHTLAECVGLTKWDSVSLLDIPVPQRRQDTTAAYLPKKKIVKPLPPISNRESH